MTSFFDSIRRHGNRRPATEVFSEWADAGRDVEMQNHHAPAVDEMLAAALAVLPPTRGFTAIDAGCGNGWIVRRLRALPACEAATGVDGSEGMIAKARQIDPSGDYVLGDLMAWRPARPVDLVVSMEVLYYMQDPTALLRTMATHWVKPGGHAVFGIDHYAENRDSLTWPGDVGVHMTTWPEQRWFAALDDAGFTRLRTWRAAAKPGHAGTLAMLVSTRGARD
ncbi:MAG TPA: class I SAM-dependent methyltransferase [Candidatus Krumholzibacteria bacterium]|nr:class I SAM-dependent methyltransferase [Candidatus Krumholzibacteria bacterium]